MITFLLCVNALKWLGMTLFPPLSSFYVHLSFSFLAIISPLRRLAQKLGLADVAASQPNPPSVSAAGTFHFPSSHPSTAPTSAPTAEPHANLLSMVQEFYTEKEIEEKRIAQLEEKAKISYFPANFRQNKQRTQEEHLSGGGTWESEDEHYASDGNNSEHSVSNFHSNATSQGNSMKYVNAPRSRRASTKSASEYSVAEIQAAVAAAEGTNFAGPRTSFTSIPTSSTKTTAFEGKHGSSKHAAKMGDTLEAGVAAGTQSNSQSRKPSTDSTPSATPTSRLSLKMQHMLNRRGSYNPSEIRLELLASIHDDQVELSPFLFLVSLFISSMLILLNPNSRFNFTVHSVHFVTVFSFSSTFLPGGGGCPAPANSHCV